MAPSLCHPGATTQPRLLHPRGHLLWVLLEEDPVAPKMPQLMPVGLQRAHSGNPQSLGGVERSLVPPEVLLPQR